MFYALDDNNVRICIDNADKQHKYHCPCCDYSVIVKQGKVNAWHFAHRPGSQCDAAYSEKTEWHRNWQEQFPEECREVVVEDITGYKRIADVKINGSTFEFQTGSIPKEIFDARNKHHYRASGRVCWIFNCIKKEISATTHAIGLDGEPNGNFWYSWSHPNRLLAKYKYHSWGMVDKDDGYVFRGVEIYLQVKNNLLIKVINIPDKRENAGWFLGTPIKTEVFIDDFVKAYRQPLQMAMEL